IEVLDLLFFLCFRYFFFKDTATTVIYTLSLHDARSDLAGLALEREVEARRAHHRLRVERRLAPSHLDVVAVEGDVDVAELDNVEDRKSTRLNSSHLGISYAVFCLKKINHM